jgi:hydrogenase maturation protease
MSELMKNPLAVSSDAFFFEKDKSQSILVLGLGNYLMGDEGIGVQVIQEMSKMELPDYVDILDGGTGGFLLLSCFESYEKIIFIDATMDGRETGHVRLIRPRFASDFPSALSVHDVGLKDMIEAVYLMEHPPEMSLFTVSIDHISPMSLELSEPVRASIPEVIERVFNLAAEMHAENN